MWGILPAQGFWLNHTRDIEFKNVKIIAESPDERPVYVKSDSENISISE